MRIVDAEWRFDRQKLTVFCKFGLRRRRTRAVSKLIDAVAPLPPAHLWADHADRYIDFRGLVRDLFAVYRTRIWMEKLGPLTS